MPEKAAHLPGVSGRLCRHHRENIHRYLVGLQETQPFHHPVKGAVAGGVLAVEVVERLVAVQGDDSYLGKAGMRPDVLPNLTEAEFRRLSVLQAGELLEASSFVKKGGSLLFLNAGITADETRHVRESFLSLRRNFELEEDFVLLPSDEKTEGGYFALFRRMEE